MEISNPVRSGDLIEDSWWPRAILVGAIFVIAVNIAFIYIAVSGADEVVPSYIQEDR